MPKKYMNQNMFDYYVCAVAELSISPEYSESEAFDLCWESYKSEFIDDGLKKDVLLGVIIANLKVAELNQFTNSDFFEQFRIHIEQHNSDDSKISLLARVFNGTLFQKSVKNPNRVKNFKVRLEEYTKNF